MMSSWWHRLFLHLMKVYFFHPSFSISPVFFTQKAFKSFFRVSIEYFFKELGWKAFLNSTAVFVAEKNKSGEAFIPLSVRTIFVVKKLMPKHDISTIPLDGAAYLENMIVKLQGTCFMSHCAKR